MGRRAVNANGNFLVIVAGVIRFSLAVVNPLDIEFTAAIGAPKQACKRVSVPPTVRAAFDVCAEPLYNIVGFLVDYGAVGVLENDPFIFGNIVVALFLIAVFRGLEIDGMP